MRDRPIISAEILSVGTELTTGLTRDSNSGDLATDLTGRGVDVRRITALPDHLETVRDAFAVALTRVDLVVSTGGLGPTPDDLTREAIAAATGTVPAVDPDLERWLRELFERRGTVMAESNRKQAWLIPGAAGLPNANGSAPGWWVDAGDGRIIIALPGPPSEMRPMWRDEATPRLLARGLGADRASETLRLTGIGESALAELIGESTLRTVNPQVATYVRPDAVDLRISAVGEAGGRPALRMVTETVAELMPRIAEYVFARGDESWPEAIGRRLVARTVSAVEIGTDGQLGAYLGGAAWLIFSETLNPRSALASAHHDLAAYAQQVREVAGTDIGLSVRARQRGGDTAVAIAIAIGTEVRQVSRVAFLHGVPGRRRAALLACTELWRALAD